MPMVIPMDADAVRIMMKYLVFLCCLLCMITIYGCGNKDNSKTVCTINGSIVTEEEMAALNGDEAAIFRMKILQQLAVEKKVGTFLSFEEIEQNLEQVNAERKKKVENSEVIYGVQQFSILQYYSLVMGDLERKLKDAIQKEVKEDELKEYYSLHKERYREADFYKITYKIYSDGVLVDEDSISIGKNNYRQMSEQNQELILNIETMKNGEEKIWIDQYGRQWNLKCEERILGNISTYEEVEGAVREQYSEEALEQLIEKRLIESNFVR